MKTQFLPKKLMSACIFWLGFSFLQANAQSFKTLSFDIFGGIALPQEDPDFTQTLHFLLMGPVTFQPTSYSLGLRTCLDLVKSENFPVEMKLLLSLQQVEMNYEQRLQPDNYAIVSSFTKVRFRQYTAGAGMGIGKTFQTNPNGYLGIQLNAELILPIVDQFTVNTEIQSYIHEEPIIRNYLDRTNNLQNLFQNYNMPIGSNLGLEISYLSLSQKRGLRPFVGIDYLRTEAMQAFIGKVGVGWVFRT